MKNKADLLESLTMEKAELDSKIEKLNAFRNSDPNISDKHKDKLWDQYTHMTEYSGDLGDRIKLVNGLDTGPFFWVHVIKGSALGYLAKFKQSGGYTNSGKSADSILQTKFSLAEIEAMKKDPGLHIDWDNALERVPDDEN